MNYGKLVVHFKLSVEDGLKFLDLPVNKRVHAGRKVNRAAARELFQREKDNLVCSCCGLKADRWIAAQQSKRDKQIWLNLFGSRNGEIVLFTRDHIIPRALGGSDAVENMRVMCMECNGNRGTLMSEADVFFLIENTHLILTGRYSTSVERLLHPKYQMVKELRSVLQNLESFLTTIELILDKLGDEADTVYPSMRADYFLLVNQRAHLTNLYEAECVET